jgi:phage host-nuclease inhibitor protein Gam
MSFLFGKWDWDMAKEVWRQEDLEDGIQIGETRAAERYVPQIKSLQEEVRRLRTAAQGQSGCTKKKFSSFLQKFYKNRLTKKRY